MALMALGAFANTSSSDPVWDNSLSWFLAVTLPVLGGLSIAMASAKSIALPNPVGRRRRDRVLLPEHLGWR